jgi:hypothetical protein
VRLGKAGDNNFGDTPFVTVWPRATGPRGFSPGKYLGVRGGIFAGESPATTWFGWRWRQNLKSNLGSGIILRDFSPEGIWRAAAQLPAFFPIGTTPDASPAQHDALAAGKGHKFSHYSCIRRVDLLCRAA